MSGSHGVHPHSCIQTAPSLVTAMIWEYTFNVRNLVKFKSNEGHVLHDRAKGLPNGKDNEVGTVWEIASALSGIAGLVTDALTKLSTILPRSSNGCGHSDDRQNNLRRTPKALLEFCSHHGAPPLWESGYPRLAFRLLRSATPFHPSMAWWIVLPIRAALVLFAMASVPINLEIGGSPRTDKGGRQTSPTTSLSNQFPEKFLRNLQNGLRLGLYPTPRKVVGSAALSTQLLSDLFEELLHRDVNPFVSGKENVLLTS